MNNTITYNTFIIHNIEAYILEKYGRDELSKFRNNEFTPKKDDEKLIELLNQNKDESTS